jgi:hypothetical protein
VWTIEFKDFLVVVLFFFSVVSNPLYSSQERKNSTRIKITPKTSHFPYKEVVECENVNERATHRAAGYTRTVMPYGDGMKIQHFSFFSRLGFCCFLFHSFPNSIYDFQNCQAKVFHTKSTKN